MKQDIKKTLITIAVLMVAFIMVDSFIGFVGEKALAKIPDFRDDFCKANYNLNRVKTDVIVVGSSRAIHHYHIPILSDSVNAYLETDYSFYNAGLDGQFVDCNACTVESILNRYSPKVVVFEVGASELWSADLYKRLTRYEPFYKSNVYVKDYLDRMGWEERVKVKVNLYRFNDRAVNIIGSLLRSGKPDDGYEPLFATMKEEQKTNEKPESKIVNKFSEGNFIRIMELCRKKHVNLVISTSPRFKPTNENELIHSLCDKYNIPYIEIYNSDFFNSHPELFKDAAHLNNNGAVIYTQMFFEKLKPHLEILKQ